MNNNRFFSFAVCSILMIGTPMLSLAKDIQARGLLVASWGKSLDADNNKKILYFDFIPENQSISNGNEISILTKKQDQQNILKTFSTIPSGFYSYQEGIATQPVSITLSNIGQETFCDSKYYYADFVKLRKIKHTKITKIPKAKCLDAYLRDDIYLIKSTDEKGVNLREKLSIPFQN
ncbi:hypothetical protein LVJ85_12350 [Neisseria sp. Dent CA1/247]|uniref:hypothetical protein n=1 Tax=Neisseria sp. Dent CA1/247 TaxID=2912675 RepID=UPI001FD5ECBD|nr:hypothetical protein [Neisseria sp. Dent CA1/247]UOO76774.1 hypothetical protein LVJ85_12350 [Neisseria sp. Dent CA1/247]